MLRAAVSVFLSLLLLLTALPTAQAGSDQLTIYLPRFTHGSGQEEFCSYASRLVQNAGFDVVFEVFAPHSANYLSDYTNFMTAHSADADCAFAAPISMLQPLCDEGWFEQIHPIDMAVQPVNRLALLVKTDLLEAYGHPIREASALHDWLYMRQSETGAVPLAASAYLYDRMYGGYMWLNLFLPETGFFALNNEFPTPYVADFYASLDGTAFYGLYDLPVAAECADRYLDWMEDGLIEHYTLRRPADLSQFDAILVNTEDFTSSLMLANNAYLADLDFTQYSLQIFYAEQLPAVASESFPASQYGICTGEDAQTQLNGFLEWLSSPDGYTLLRYGEEGVDYTLDDGALVPSDTSNYILWEQRVLFERSELEPELLRPNLPANFDEELALLESAPEPLYAPEAFADLAQKLSDAGLTLTLSKLSAANHAFFESVYTSAFTPSIREQTHRWLDTVIKPESEYAPCVDLLYEYLLFPAY